MHELEKSRLDYDQQKTTKEEKQAEVEALKLNLEKQQKQLLAQQAAKKQLLAETRNSEVRYQTLLEKAVAELRAIESIIAGKGTEVEVRDVSEGEVIASVMTSGPNLHACSSGPHLHFEVVKNKTHQNPFSYLSSKNLTWGNSDSPQNGTGSWNWPLNDIIRITQGYGRTSYSSIYANNTHTGIDMVNTSDYSVKSVKKGKLYRGGVQCRDGTLQYVHVDHADDDLDTYYLHVNYF